MNCKGEFPKSLAIFWFALVFITFPVASAQFETGNDGCGGIFRSIKGSIYFKINDITYPETTDTNKTCLWTIIPHPLYTAFRISVDRYQLNNTTDSLGFTTFLENRIVYKEERTATEPGEFVMVGQVLVVVLILPYRNLGGGVELHWDRSEDSEMITRTRFVTAYNSYGKSSTAPPTYFAASFVGNSLSTFGVTKGNNTEGFELGMEIPVLELESRICQTRVYWYGFGCDVLLVNRIETSATLSTMGYWNDSLDFGERPTFTSEFGFFLIMWGGNPFNASGGGRMELKYETKRPQVYPLPPRISPAYYDYYRTAYPNITTIRHTPVRFPNFRNG